MTCYHFHHEPTKFKNMRNMRRRDDSEESSKALAGGTTTDCFLRTCTGNPLLLDSGHSVGVNRALSHHLGNLGERMLVQDM